MSQQTRSRAAAERELDGDDMMTADQAIIELLSEAKQRVGRGDKNVRGLFRYAECTAWANQERAGGTKTENGAMWGQLAIKVAEAFHTGMRLQKWPEIAAIGGV